MKLLWVLACAAALTAQTQTAATSPSTDADSSSPGLETSDGTRATDPNVNSRYTVESVGLLNPRRYHLSRSLVDDMQHLVGARFSSDVFQNLAERISSELQGHPVVFKLARGAEPGRIRVTFEVNGPTNRFDLDVPRFVYNTAYGFSGEGDGIAYAGANKFTFGVLSDGDSMVERASGIRARYDRTDLADGRVHLSFEFDSFHDQFNPATATAAMEGNDFGALYRDRQVFQPEATILLSGPLSWTVGLSFEQLHFQSPAAGTESSNAIVNTLRYDRGWDDSASGTHRLDAGYTLRAATSLFGSAYAYARHAVNMAYHWKRDRQSAQVEFMGGVVTGNAPLYDRFVLGTSSTLRGWDKYSLDPLGGTRVVYGSAGYGYRKMRMFYDVGSVWSSGEKPSAKQSAGVGVKVEGVMFAMAFPIRNDHIEPVFIAGMNF